jgi:hypothetical protein
MQWYIPMAALWILLFRVQQGVCFFGSFEVLWVSAAVLGASFLFMFLLHVLPKGQRSMAGIMMIVLMVPSFLFTSFAGIVRSIGLSGDADWNKRSFFVFLSLAAMVLLLVIIRPAMKKGIERYFMWLFAALCLYQSLTLVLAIPRMARIASLSKDVLRGTGPSVRLDTTGVKDIYFIVFDAYGGNASLRRHFNYDNARVTDTLRALGFAVSDHALSAYHSTPYSISSVLNMDAVYDWGEGMSGTYVNMTLLLQQIRQNRLTRILSGNGYQVRNLSFFDLDQAGRQRSFKPFTASRGLARFMLENSILLRFFVNPVDHRQGESNLGTLNDLKSIIRSDTSRKFVYAHVMLPHAAYYVDSSGRFYPGGEGKYGNVEKDHLEQVKYANDWIIGIASDIVRYRPGSMVVIQGDHGSLIHFNGSSTVVPDESNNPFSAVRVPPGCSAAIPDTLYAPNTFRILLNAMSASPELPLLHPSPETYRKPGLGE